MYFRFITCGSSIRDSGEKNRPDVHKKRLTEVLSLDVCLWLNKNHEHKNHDMKSALVNVNGRVF